jgi:hypothetical protein
MPPASITTLGGHECFYKVQACSHANISTSTRLGRRIAYARNPPGRNHRAGSWLPLRVLGIARNFSAGNETMAPESWPAVGDWSMRSPGYSS